MKGEKPRVTITERYGGAVVRLSGIIDEHFDGSAAKPIRGVLVIDLDGVHRIVSSGVRKWLEMINGLQASFYCFVQCRPAMVSQFNLVRQFGGRGCIVSLYAPFVCECGQATDELFDLRRQQHQLHEVARAGVLCKSCRGQAQFDDFADDYFECVEAPLPALPQAVIKIIGDSEGRLKIVKDVFDDLTALWLLGTVDTPIQFKRVVDALDGHLVLVFQAVTAVTERGYQTLETFLSTPHANVVLARVPLTIAVGLVRTGKLGRAGLASVLVRLTCPICWETSEYEATAELTATVPVPERRCPCGQTLVWPTADWAVVMQVPFVTPSPDVVAYLDAHAEPPEVVHRDTPTESWSDTSNVEPPWRHPRYKLLGRIAEGGMGVVHLGSLTGAGGFERRVAIKRIRHQIATNPEFVSMFLDEARIAAQIHHPNVVSTIDVEHGPEGLFLVMEFVEGCSGERVIAALSERGASPPPGLSLRIILDLLAGLHAAHELRGDGGESLNLVHRDVSPANLLIGFDGVCRLSDFGIARADRRLSQSTLPGELKGKLAYLSPEQLSDQGLDRRSDIYSAGIVAWELLAGRRLFVDASGRGALYAVLEGAKLAPDAVNPAVPAAIAQIVMRALASDRAERFATAAEFSEALEHASQASNVQMASARVVGDAIRALTTPLGERKSEPRVRNP